MSARRGRAAPRLERETQGHQTGRYRSRHKASFGGSQKRGGRV